MTDRSGYQSLVTDVLADRPRLKVADPQPPIPDWCEESNCTFNASEVADELGLTYAEGWAKVPWDDAWIAHAWCLNEAGEVVDPTWKDTSPAFTYVEAAEFDPFCRAADSNSPEVER